jgi:hypothetical protein
MFEGLNLEASAGDALTARRDTRTAFFFRAPSHVIRAWWNQDKVLASVDFVVPRSTHQIPGSIRLQFAIGKLLAVAVTQSLPPGWFASTKKRTDRPPPNKLAS